MMLPISEELEKKFAQAAEEKSPAELADLAERLSIETCSACIVGVKAGAFESEEQTEFCKRAYGLFTHDWVDLLYMLGLQIEWVKSLAYRFRVPLNKSLQGIIDALLDMLAFKRQSGRELVVK